MKRAASPAAASPAPAPVVVHRAVFRAADAAPAVAARLPDLAGFLRALAVEIARTVTLPATVERGDALAPAPGGFVRADGFSLGIEWPELLPAAVVAHRFGGSFVPVSLSPPAPSVARLRAELDAAALRAADATWPGEGAWSRAVLLPDAVPFAATLTIEGHRFDLGMAVGAVAAAPAGPSTNDAAAWTHALRTALDTAPFDVRAVLHARPLRLGAALALAPGDVLPIDTPRDVALRIGPHTLARGTITPDAGGGHRVTVVAAPGATHAPYEDCP